MRPNRDHSSDDAERMLDLLSGLGNSGAVNRRLSELSLSFPMGAGAWQWIDKNLSGLSRIRARAFPLN
jgi:hypothetical protein